MAARYTDEQKQEVVNFVLEYDQANGRGGQAAAKKKFGINPISIKKWLVDAGHAAGPKKKSKKSGSRGRRKAAAKASGSAVEQVAARSAAAPAKKSSNASILAKMTKIQDQIDSLQKQFDALKAKL